MADPNELRVKLFRPSRRQIISSMAALGALGAFPAGSVLAQKRITVTEGEFAPTPIAIPSFVPGSAADGDVSNGVSQVITNNLKRSGLFAPVDPSAFVERITDFDKVPQFASWKPLNVQALVTGRMTRQGDGRLKAEFRLWDVTSGQQLAGQQYVTAP